MAFHENMKNGVVWMTADNLKTVHGFTTRWGGVSTDQFDSLNLSEIQGDAEENVRENYRRLGEALGIDTSAMAFTKQVHKNTVRTVTKDDVRAPFDPFLYEADGIVTNVKGLPLIAFTADCVPVLLFDEENSVCGAIHCGWRSSVSDILGEAVAAMIALGAVPHCIHAAIGPAIGFCCFETGPEVPEAIERWLGGDCDGLFFPIGNGKFMTDLQWANQRRLLQLGIKAENIDVSDECTVCNSDKYWSHRATNGKRGSQAAVIVL